MRSLLIFTAVVVAPVMSSFFAPSSSSVAPAVVSQPPWNPESKFETFGAGLDVPNLQEQPFDLEKTSIAFLSSYLDIDPSSLLYKQGYEDDITKHAFVTQAINGIPFTNAEAHVTYNKANKVVSLSSSFVALIQTSVASSVPTIPVEAAIESAETNLNGRYNNHPTKLEYLARPDSAATLVFSIQVQNDREGTWFEGYIDAHTGDLVAATSFVA